MKIISDNYCFDFVHEESADTPQIHLPFTLVLLIHEAHPSSLSVSTQRNERITCLTNLLLLVIKTGSLW